jgi:hypothetical protein
VASYAIEEGIHAKARERDPMTEDTKFANTVLYMLRGCKQYNPGVTVLLKLLFLADLEHYRRHLRSISGARYVALQRGPVIDGYKQLFDRLVELEYLEPSEVEVAGHPEQPKLEYIPKVEPDDSVFTASELDILRDTIRCHGWKTGTELTELTHTIGPWPLIWKAEEPGRKIPFVAFRWLDNLPDDSDLEAARQLLATGGAQAELKKLGAVA